MVLEPGWRAEIGWASWWMSSDDLYCSRASFIAVFASGAVLSSVAGKLRDGVERAGLMVLGRNLQ